MEKSSNHKPNYKPFFIISIIFLIIILFVSIFELNRIKKSRLWVVHSYEVILLAKEIFQEVQNIEIKNHKFLLTNDASFLQNYLADVDLIKKHMNDLVFITQDNDTQNATIKKLQSLVNIKINLLNQFIQLKNTEKNITPNMINLIIKEHAINNEILSNSNMIKQTENTLLGERASNLKFNYYVTHFGLLVGEMLALVCMLIAFHLINAEFKRRSSAEKRSKEVENQIRSIIESSTDMIAAMDTNHKLILFNHAYQEEVWKVFKLKLKQGTKIFELFKTKPEGEQLIKAWMETLSGHERKQVFNFTTKEGIRSFELSASVVKDHHNKIIGAVHFIRNITEHTKEQMRLTEAYEKINMGMMDLKDRNHKITLLVEMSDVMLACASLNEASQVVVKFAKKILTASGGLLYIADPTTNNLVLKDSWGSVSPQGEIMPRTCWSLRLNHINYSGANTKLFCTHIINPNYDFLYVCVPLRAQNEIYGLLYFETQVSNDRLSENEELVLNAFTELVALSLSNVRLKENLEHQSVHDPLTTLYNRRFLTEYLYKQIHLAEREEVCIAVMMLDIDHFKNFNDSYGHDAGDYVLKVVGNILNKIVRSGDLAARYGGEEFILTIFKANPKTIKQRAEGIREEFKKANLIYQGQKLGNLTVSIGIALFPRDGDTGEKIITLADKALYVAKERGRDKVIDCIEIKDLLV